MKDGRQRSPDLPTGRGSDGNCWDLLRAVEFAVVIRLTQVAGLLPLSFAAVALSDLA